MGCSITFFLAQLIYPALTTPDISDSLVIGEKCMDYSADTEV